MAQRNPGCLPLWLRLDEWDHPDLAAGEMRSEMGNLRLLGEAIATGNPGLYRPTSPEHPPVEWLEGGTL